MEKQIVQVSEFQKAFGVEEPKRPTLLTKKRAALRQRLLAEEVSEIAIAQTNEDIVGVADGIIDSMYILIGTAYEYGLSDRLVLMFDEVHRSNMTKMGPDGKAIFRKDGKVMKPKNYSPPKLELIINRDFSLYKENDTLKAIADVEKKITENKIIAKISSKLRFFDRILFHMYNRTEKYLGRKVSVKFPTTIHGNVVVEVYGKEHEIL
jgi:predicted HAD superfamily Cof-like phosphohydrolase